MWYSHAGPTGLPIASYVPFIAHNSMAGQLVHVIAPMSLPAHGPVDLILWLRIRFWITGTGFHVSGIPPDCYYMICQVVWIV